jgi:hypothetical protein
MRKIYLTISIFILILLLSSCVGQPARAKSLKDIQLTTIAPTQTVPTETTQAEVASSTPPKSCPVTVPQQPPFEPPAPYSDLGWYGNFWYGSHSLWVALPQNGIWSSLPHNPEGYTQKIPWWREGYDWEAEPEPALIVTGERLDVKAPPLNASTANGSYAPDMGSAMMMAVDFPTLGCWAITGKYKDVELRFVVWVAP